MSLPTTQAPSAKRLKAIEGTATFGLLLICVALVAPFANPADLDFLNIFKWIFSAGALVYLAARAAGAADRSGSLRLRRLRRMEFWAGVAFALAAAMWFYAERHLGQYAGVLAVLKNTILFTLAGAVIQIIASSLISSQTKKEARNTAHKDPKA